MDTSPIKHTKWSDRLAFDVALTLEGSGETLQEVITRHSIAASDILEFNKDPIFHKKVETYRTEIRDKGMTFRLRPAHRPRNCSQPHGYSSTTPA